MAKYGVCVSIKESRSLLYLSDAASKKLEQNLTPILSETWTIKMSEAAKFSTMNKAQDAMLLIPLELMHMGLPKLCGGIK